MGFSARFVKASEGEALPVLGSAMLVKATSDELGGLGEVVLIESGPGGDIIPHRHPWAELYYVLDGTMAVQVGTRTHDASRGDLVTIPSRALHGFRVTSERARFLHISFGAGATKAFAEYARDVPHAPELDDLPAILDINARHGIELLLPSLA